MCDYSLHNVASRPAKVGDNERQAKCAAKVSSFPLDLNGTAVALGCARSDH
jgi:hypothetical protein